MFVCVAAILGEFQRGDPVTDPQLRGSVRISPPSCTNTDARARRSKQIIKCHHYHRPICIQRKTNGALSNCVHLNNLSSHKHRFKNVKSLVRSPFLLRSILTAATRASLRQGNINIVWDFKTPTYIRHVNRSPSC